MSLVTLCSSKGSPGVTTLAMVLADLWPAPVLLADLDPDGGDLAPRLGLGFELGLLSVAARGRAGLGWASVEAALQPAGRAQVLAGVADPGQARGLAVLWDPLAALLAEADFLVLADLGRLRPDNPAARACVGRAALNLVLTRLDPASLAHTSAALAALDGLPALVVGRGPGSVPAGWAVEAVWAEDRAAAAELAGVARRYGYGRFSKLVATAKTVARLVSERVEPAGAAGTGPPDAALPDGAATPEGMAEAKR